MFNKLFNKINDKINTIKEENNNYNELLNNSSTLNSLNPLPDLSRTPTKKSPNIITDCCPDINKEKAIIINKLIPIEEAYLEIYYIKEIKTNIDYWFILTNKNIWIINEKNYSIIPYQNITICNIIKNNLMSKIININNILFEVNGNNQKINTLISTLNNTEYREQLIKEKTNFLCDIIPVYQLINEIHSGISIDSNNNIVFHSKDNNYKVALNELTNYEVLIDNNSIICKNQDRNTTLNTFSNGCYSISIRITTNNSSFVIPILEQNAFGTKYSINDNVFQNSMNFAKEIINKLNEICNNT